MFSFSSLSKTTWIGLGVVAATLGYIFWPKKAHAAAPAPVLPKPKPGPGPTPSKDLTSFYNQGHSDGLTDGDNDATNGLAYHASPGSGGRTLPTDSSELASYTTGYNVGYAEGYGKATKLFAVPSTDDVGGPVTPDISKGTGAPKPTADYAGAAFNAGYASGKIDGYQDGKAGYSPNPRPDPAATETAFYKSNYIPGYNNAYGMFYEGGRKDSIVAPSSTSADSTPYGTSDSPDSEPISSGGTEDAVDGIFDAFSLGTRLPSVGQSLVRQNMAGGKMIGSAYLPNWWSSMPRVTPAHFGMWAPPARTGYTSMGASVYGLPYSQRPSIHPYRG